MKLKYQILKGILQWAETLEADGDFLGLIDNWAEIGVGFQTKARTLPR